MIIGYATETKIGHFARSGPGTIKSVDGTERSMTIVTYDTNIRQPKQVGSKLEREIQKLKTVAKYANAGVIDLVYSHEVDLELLFQPLIDVPPGRFFGAPCTRIPSPLIRNDAFPNGDSDDKATPQLTVHHPSVEYMRYRSAIQKHPDKMEDILREFLLFLPVGNFGYWLDYRYLLTELRETFSIPNAAKLMLPILKSIKSPRYREICRKLNAQNNANTYMDAYHLWTGECNKCTFFMTTEKTIQRLYDGPLSVVFPSELTTFDAYNIK